MATVKANVLVRDPKTGAVTVITAGEEIPRWAKPQVGAHLIEEAQAKRAPARRAKPKPSTGSEEGSAEAESSEQPEDEDS